MKKLLIFITFIALMLSASYSVQAEDVTCVTQYGGAVVCGAATPPFHAPVKTGIADFNLPLLGFLFIGSAAFLYRKSKKALN